jgi:hypothetical protein
MSFADVALLVRVSGQRLMGLQQASFAAGVINAGVQLMGLSIYIIAVRRWANKKRLERLERRSEGGY